MPLSHILNGIYSTEENPMDVINGTLHKGKTPREGETPRKKWVQNVQTEEVRTKKGKDNKKPTDVPRKVTFKKIPLPTELNQQIVADEDITYAGKSKKHSSKKNMDESAFIRD